MTALHAADTGWIPKNGEYYVAVLIGTQGHIQRRLIRNLASMGIHVPHTCAPNDKLRAVPDDADLVIIVTSYVSHRTSNAAMKLVRSSGVPFVLETYKWTFMSKTLTARGLSPTPEMVERATAMLGRAIAPEPEPENEVDDPPTESEMLLHRIRTDLEESRELAQRYADDAERANERAEALEVKVRRLESELLNANQHASQLEQKLKQSTAVLARTNAERGVVESELAELRRAHEKCGTRDTTALNVSAALVRKIDALLVGLDAELFSPGEAIARLRKLVRSEE
jgi:hypothetical protein